MYATTGFNSHCHSGGNLLEPSVCWHRTLAHDARTRVSRAHPRKLPSLPSAAKPPTLYSLFKIPFVPYVSVVKNWYFPALQKFSSQWFFKKKIFQWFYRKSLKIMLKSLICIEISDFLIKICKIWKSYGLPSFRRCIYIFFN